MKKKITVFPDPILTVGASIFFHSLILFLLIAAIFLIPKDEKNIVGIYLVSVVSILLEIGIILCTPQWYSRFTFSPDGVIIKIPFKKSVVKSYTDFPYIRIGAYFHGVAGTPLGSWRKFIVFSDRSLEKNELSGINNVVCSNKLIKIKFSERTYQKLCAILPPNSLSMLERELTRQLPYEQGKQR